MGGTFDPIHCGHLLVARSAAELLGVTQIMLIPCAQSPHKASGPQADLSQSHHRLAMLEAVAREDPLFKVLSIELDRPPPSYTYETVNQLFQQGWGKPGSDLAWLIGADQLQALPRWHRASELIEQIRFVIAARPGWSFDFNSLPPAFRALEHNVLPIPSIDISATQVRQRVRSGQSIRYLVPAPVERYIQDHQLYK
jgi:nicotinate-nucleotide adenylyltransferase